MRSLKQAVRQCVIETLEQRRLLSVPPIDSFVGPLPQLSRSGGTSPPPSAPTAELTAPLLSTSKIDHYFMSVTYRDDVAVRATSIDGGDIRVRAPGGAWHNVELDSTDRSTDGPVIAARYRFYPPGGSWDSGDNGIYTVQLRDAQIYDTHGNAAAGASIGTFEIRIPNPANPPTPVDKGVDVRDFGAIPNDGIDDTAAIQAAINSLPMSNGVPTAEVPMGGIVLLSAGTYDINRSIKLPSGVTLRGAGSGATVIHDTGSDRNHSAILYYSPFTHRYNLGATVDNLSIYSRWGRGITIDPNMGGSVIELRLANLRVSSMGPAIDLMDQAVYHSSMDNVEIYNPGSTALRIGRYDGEGANFLLRNIRVTGTARSGFQAQRGLVWLSADSLVQGLKISTAGANVVPLYISSNGLNVSAGGPTMFDVDIQVPAANCPGGIAAHFDDVARVDVDSLLGIGADHKLKLTKAHDVQIAYVGSDGTTNIVSAMVVIDSRSHLRIGNNAGGALVFAPRPQPQAHVRVPSPTIVIDAKSFGVIADDGRDDTVALQAAIDSLPRNSGIPGSNGLPVGGIVQLPLGMLNTSAPIKLPSGVWLRGHNNGTTIRNFATPFGRAVIELTSPYSHGSNVGAALDSLGIHSSFATAVKSDSTITGELRDLRLAAVRMRVGGAGIDLRNVTVNYANIDRVNIHHPGSTAIWLGKPDNSSVGNIVRGLRITGRVNPAFRNDKAMFVFYGDTTLEGGSIEDGWLFESTTPMLALYASGKLTANGVYMEYARHSSNIAWHLDNVQGSIDRLYHISTWRRVGLFNGSNVTMRSLNIDGYYAHVKDCVWLDGTSRLTLNSVHSAYDAGSLDHPRMIVNGFFNKNARTFIETNRTTRGTNLLADPLMRNVSDNPWSSAAWQIVWGDGTRGPLGSWTVETIGDQTRLRIDLSAPAYFDVRAKLNVPSSAVGKDAIASWRVDAPAGVQVFVDNRNEAAQFPARAMGSLTAAKTVMPLRAGEELWFQVGSATNPAPAGTYYFWKVGVVAT